VFYRHKPYAFLIPRARLCDGLRLPSVDRCSSDVALVRLQNRVRDGVAYRRLLSRSSRLPIALRSSRTSAGKRAGFGLSRKVHVIRSRLSELVNLASVAYGYNVNHHFVVKYLIDHTIIPDANAPGVLKALQLAAAGGTSVLS